MLSVDEVPRLVPIPTDGLVGGMHGERDLQVDPARPSPDWRGGSTRIRREPLACPVHGVEPGAFTARGSASAPLIIVCPGPDYRSSRPSSAPAWSR